MKRRSCQEYRQCFAAREAATEDEVPSQSSEDHLQLVRGDEDSRAELGKILDHLGVLFGSGLGRVGGEGRESQHLSQQGQKWGARCGGGRPTKRMQRQIDVVNLFMYFLLFFLKYGQGEV